MKPGRVSLGFLANSSTGDMTRCSLMLEEFPHEDPADAALLSNRRSESMKRQMRIDVML